MTLMLVRRKGLTLRNRHVIYASFITYNSKVMANVKVCFFVVVVVVVLFGLNVTSILTLTSTVTSMFSFSYKVFKSLISMGC